MGKVMTDQQQVRTAIRDAIAKYRTGGIGLGQMIIGLLPLLEGLQPDEVWEDAEEIYSELDTYYATVATHEGVELTRDQLGNIDRLLTDIERIAIGS